MARVCAVCLHAKKTEIDQALVSGESAAAIASRFEVSPYSVSRHKVSHLPATMQKAQAVADVSHADDLFAQVRELQAKAMELLRKAEKERDFKTALSGVREARGCLELRAKLEGQISDAPQVNITINAQWLELRAVIVQALAPFPDARVAVAEALQSMEAPDAGQ